jgi:hypothetical protein
MMERLITFLAASALVALSTGIVFAHDAETALAAADAKAAAWKACRASPASRRRGAGFADRAGHGRALGQPQEPAVRPDLLRHRGKVTCMEYMISQADFEAGKSWTELKPWF